MQGQASDKTFHLKWNNHLQNLSQLFTTIYSSAALADVTLSCRDGTLKAHKLVLSACSPYFEQIFKDNPCQHPVVILKGIPFSEINLLVEFMYKGSVDVQELDLQSLMHTASELEVRGLAYEARDGAAQLLNVNLEYPAYPAPAPAPSAQPYAQPRTDVERLKQIHLYQQSMMRAEEVRRRRAEEASPARTHAAVTNILAAAAREMEEARHAARAAHPAHPAPAAEPEPPSPAEEGRKRSSILQPEDDKLRARKKPMTVRFQDDGPDDADANTGSGSGEAGGGGGGGLKVVQLAALQAANHAEAEGAEPKPDSETESSGSLSDGSAGEGAEARPHSCDVCSLRFQRASHLSRHRLTHTGERPFTCGGCGRSFARSDKLRVHTKICEREDPTVEPPGAGAGDARRESAAVMSGMVRTTHRESTHLVFTPGGDVMLPARAAPRADADAALDPPRRGRGRPRKTPLPMTPKIKKRRGRPPKTSLDMEGCVLTAGAVPAAAALASHQLLLKRRRGRPPKNYFLPRTDGRPNENYNATNLPFGDFSYLTDMMYNPLAYYGDGGAGGAAGEGGEGGEAGAGPRAIDVSDSESSGSERAEPEEAGARVLTVGDCQIVKLPPPEAGEPAAASAAPGSAVTITPITTVGDCTIRPLDTA